MKKYLSGLFKYNFKILIGIRKNISIFSLIDGRSIVSKNAAVARKCKLNNVSIGDYSYISKGSDLSNCKIGKFCSIAPSVKIGFGTHPTSFLSTSPLFYTKRNIFGFSIVENKDIEEFKEIIIGNDVWIGLNAVILDGVTIGDGAIIAAGAVVVNDVPSYAIVGGVPAKLIKYRFNEKVIYEISKTKWWDMDINSIKSLKDKVYNVNKFIKK